MRFLKNKLSRAVAFLAAVVLSVITMYNLSGLLNEYEILRGGRQDYISNYRYDRDVFSLYSKLWLTGNMYLRNLDSKEQFIGSETLKASVRKTMLEERITDISGNFIFMDTPFEYYVCYGNHSLTNIKTDNVYEYFNNNAYSLMYENGKFVKEGDHCQKSYNILYDSYWFTTDNKMYYYNTGYETAAIFDFDTRGLEYSTDRFGTKIYHKQDQTAVNTDVVEYERYSPENDESVKKYSDLKVLKIYIVPNSACIEENISAIKEHESIRQQFGSKILFIVLFAFLTLAVTVLGFVMTVCGIDRNKSGRYFSEKIFSEIPPVFIFINAVLITAMVHPDVSEHFTYLAKEYNVKIPFYVLQCPVVAVSYAVIIIMFNCLIIKIIRRSILKTSLTGMFFSKLSVFIAQGYVLHKNAFARKFLIRTAIFSAAGSIVMIFLYYYCGEVILLITAILIIALYIYLSLRDFDDLKKLSEHITSVSEGDYTRKQLSQTSPLFFMTEKLNCISDGIQSEVEKRISSEKMKIDLVTNVSHDLKTPLTSIISYVDLLSSEELPDTAKDYVKILQQKTDGLKSIVSDLFDLAKATSGTDINSEMIDAVILFTQVLSDMSDKISIYGREIKTDVSIEKAPIFADGKKLYRVIQNITENALKYSLEKTRIYFRLFTEDNDVVISVKNIASYEMNFSPEEITERFVRGDKSRTGDGNGLGLAIAKSFTEACGGKLEVIVDGDVFTVLIRFKMKLTQLPVEN